MKTKAKRGGEGGRRKGQGAMRAPTLRAQTLRAQTSRAATFARPTLPVRLSSLPVRFSSLPVRLSSLPLPVASFPLPVVALGLCLFALAASPLVSSSAQKGDGGAAQQQQQQALNLHQWGAVTLFHGLPSERVRAVAQDAEGVMWFGTDAGLARYDGRRTQTVSVEGLAQGRVLALQFDAEAGALWAGTEWGAAVLGGGRWRAVEETKGKAVTAILVPSRGRAVLATNGGQLFECSVEVRGDPDGGNAAGGSGAGGNDAASVNAGGGGVAGATGDGVVVAGEPLRARAFPPEPLQSADDDRPGPLELTSLARGADGTLYAGTRSRGLLAARGEAFEEVTGRPRPYFVEALERDAAGALWVGARGGGAGLYTTTGGQQLRRRAEVSGAVGALRRDAAGDIWVGTTGQGALRFRDGRLVERFDFEGTAGGLRSNNVLSIFIDREGVVWFGTDRGVCRYDPLSPRNETVGPNKDGNFVRALLATRDGRLLAGTNRGLFVFDERASVWSEISGFASKAVYALAEEPSGRVLAGTSAGLFDAARGLHPLGVQPPDDAREGDTTNDGYDASTRDGDAARGGDTGSSSTGSGNAGSGGGSRAPVEQGGDAAGAAASRGAAQTGDARQTGRTADSRAAERAGNSRAADRTGDARATERAGDVRAAGRSGASGAAGQSGGAGAAERAGGEGAGAGAGEAGAAQASKQRERAESVRAIRVFRGATYVAVYGRGVERLDGDRRAHVWPPAGADARLREVTTLHAEGDSRLWAGTAGAGLFAVEGDANGARAPSDGVGGASDDAGGTAQQLRGVVVWSIDGDSERGLWLATSGGLFFLRAGAGPQLVVPNLDARGVVAQPASDGSPAAWAATGGGVLRVKLDAQFGPLVSRLDVEQGLASSHAFAIIRLDAPRAPAGANDATRNANHATPRTNEAARHTNEAARHTNEASRATNDAARGANDTANVANDAEREADDVAREGDDAPALLFGTTRGVVRYTPGASRPVLVAVRVLSRRLHQPAELREGVALDYPQNSLALDVAAQSSRTFPEQFLYAFVLRDRAGRELRRRIANDPQFVMENLQPGPYTVEARAYTKDLVSSYPFSFDFTVGRAPFPRTTAALAVLLTLALVALFWGWWQNREMARATAALAQANHELASARLNLANEAERERRRIARDLHDQTLADLRSLMLLTDQLPPSVAPNGSGVERQGRAARVSPAAFRSEIESISTEIRRICEDLSPSALDNVGLAAALEWALTNAAAHCPESEHFEHRFSADEDLDDRLQVEPGVRMQIYRIAQEAITNVCRHARAQNVRLSVSLSPEGELRLLLEDDGRSDFDPRARRARRGRGLASIRDRASLIEAEAEWERLPAGGTRFTLRKSNAAKRAGAA
jgi:signal transduction histidine kinase/ligand-binding sensor domain-containing protein